MTARNVCIALAVISAVACGGGSPTGTQSGGNTNPPPGGGGVSVTNNAFTPATTTVAPGATVTWAWSTCTGDPYGGSQTCVSHNVVFDDGATSGLKDQGTYTRTFTAAGTYNYHCSVHVAQGMVGSIAVQ